MSSVSPRGRAAPSAIPPVQQAISSFWIINQALVSDFTWNVSTFRNIYVVKKKKEKFKELSFTLALDFGFCLYATKVSQNGQVQRGSAFFFHLSTICIIRYWVFSDLHRREALCRPGEVGGLGQLSRLIPAKHVKVVRFCNTNFSRFFSVNLFRVLCKSTWNGRTVPAPCCNLDDLHPV